MQPLQLCFYASCMQFVGIVLPYFFRTSYQLRKDRRDRLTQSFHLIGTVMSSLGGALSQSCERILSECSMAAPSHHKRIYITPMDGMHLQASMVQPQGRDQDLISPHPH